MTRNIHYVAIEMLKVKNDLSPSFFSDMFQTFSGNTRTGDKFIRQSVNTVKKGENSLTCPSSQLSGMKCYLKTLKLCTNLN